MEIVSHTSNVVAGVWSWGGGDGNPGSRRVCLLPAGKVNGAGRRTEPHGRAGAERAGSDPEELLDVEEERIFAQARIESERRSSQADGMNIRRCDGHGLGLMKGGRRHGKAVVRAQIARERQP